MRWTEAAWQDLEAAVDYIARDSRYYAAAFARELRERARSLERFALRGRMVPELGNPDIRELGVRGFRLVYQVREDAVFVLAVIHGARDLGALWAREGRTGPAPKDENGE